MKKLLIFLLLALPAFGQTYNTNILPAQTGLTLGRNGQRWNLYGQNIHITGSFTAPVVTSSPTPASGYMNGYFKAGRGWCAKDSLGREYCPGGGTTSGGGTPGGSDTNLQYNNNGAFGGFPDGGVNTVLHGGRTFSAVVEADQTLADNTTANVSITKHGYAPKLSNNSLQYLDGTGAWSTPAGGGGGASTATTYIPLEDCTPDQTGNSFYSVASMTNWFNAHWEFATNAASYINCKVRIPNTVAATPAASIVLEISANDNTSGHTANFQSCDAVATTGFQVSAPSCAANQAFTTTTTAYERVTKTYAVQSTVAANNLLVVKIATATTGTQPSANMIVYPYLKIDQNSVGGGGGGGGTGTVTSFSAGDLSPLFTTTEATTTTTPALTFVKSDFAAHTFYGNNTGSTAAPGAQLIAQGDVTGLVAALALLAPKASPTFTGTVTMPAPILNNVTGLIQCLENDAVGQTHGTGLPCGSGGAGPASIKSMSNYANAQAALTAITSGQTLLVDGTFTLCNGTLTASNVVIKGAGFQSGILQCATNNVPVLTVSGNSEVRDLNIKHITNTPIVGGDGLVVAPGTTSVRIIDNIIQNSYNGLNVGNTSFGVIEGNYIQFNQNHALVFTADGTSQVMQWMLKGNLFAQSLGNGVDFTLGAAISGLHITGPTIVAGNRAYGNGGKGYNFSASAATASGISDVFIGGQSFASYNNATGLYMDLGANGGRNSQITGFFSELSGQSTNTAGFQGGTTLTPSNIGHGIEITSACDPTNPPQINGLETWQNSFSGAISSCAGTLFSDVTAYKNGMATSANSYERAAVAIRASRIGVNGGYAHDNTTQQLYGIDISNSADLINISFTCSATYTAPNCIKQTTTPASLTATLPTGSILTSPALLGVSTAPTAAPGTNTTQVATTAFVLANTTSATTTYYVSNAGSDAANGTTTTTPWLTVSKVNSSTFNPGDRVLFLRDGTWREQLTIPSSGTATLPITIGAYGTGAAPILTGMNVITSFTIDSGTVYHKTGITQPSVVSFNGKMLKRNPVTTSIGVGEWDWSASGSTLYINAGVVPSTGTVEIGARTYALYATGKSFVTVDGISLQGANQGAYYLDTSTANFTLQNSDIQRTNWGVVTTSTTGNNNTVQDNQIHDTVEYGINWGQGGNSATGTLIQRNSIYGIGGKGGTATAAQGIYMNTGAGVSILYNSVHDGGDSIADHGIYMASASLTGNHAKVAFNRVYNYTGFGIKVSTASSFVDVYGNLIHNVLGGGIIVDAGTPTDINIYNNTIVGDPAGFNTEGLVCITGNRIAFRNNIVYGINYSQFSYNSQFNEYVANASNCINITFNYNLVWSPTPNASGYYASIVGVGSTWAGWQGLGNEVNGVNADPKFVNAAANDFRLATGSPAIGAGLTLGSPYDVGINSFIRASYGGEDSTMRKAAVGAPVSQTNFGAWDIGAFVADSTLAQVPAIELCGTTTVCAKTIQSAPLVVYGTVALTSGSPSTATLTALPFTSTSSYVCTGTNQTTATNNLIKFSNASATSTVITGPNTITDVIGYHCTGN